MPRSAQPELLQGTLDVMILAVLEARSLHGYGIARQIELGSGNALAIEEGSLYPALHRMSKRGELAAEWRQTHTGRRARFYRLTPEGRRRLVEQANLWDTLSAAVSRVVHGQAQPASASASAWE